MTEKYWAEKIYEDYILSPKNRDTNAKMKEYDIKNILNELSSFYIKALKNEGVKK